MWERLFCILKRPKIYIFSSCFSGKNENFRFWSIYPGNFGSYRSRIFGNDRLVHLRAGIRVSDQRKVSVRQIFMIRTWDERNIAICSGVYMIRVRRSDLNGSQRLEKMFEHEMTKTKMRLQRKKISPSKKWKVAWMGRSGELLKFWLKIFQQIDDSGFSRVLAILQNMDFWSILKVFYPQKIIKFKEKYIFSAFLGYNIDAPIFFRNLLKMLVHFGVYNYFFACQHARNVLSR